MRVNKLIVLQDKGWKPASTFTNGAGRSFQVPASHKFILRDEKDDIINATVNCEAPLLFKIGDSVDGLELAGTATLSTFGWTCKFNLIKPAK